VSNNSVEEGRDYYVENGLLVFTEHYLRRRGTCCRSGCRHCPYGFRQPDRPAPTRPEAAADQERPAAP